MESTQTHDIAATVRLLRAAAEYALDNCTPDYTCSIRLHPACVLVEMRGDGFGLRKAVAYETALASEGAAIRATIDHMAAEMARASPNAA